MENSQFPGNFEEFGSPVVEKCRFNNEIDRSVDGNEGDVVVL